MDLPTVQLPTLNLPPELLKYILDALGPAPPEPLQKEPFKHFPVDKNFIEMLESLKPVEVPYTKKPDNPMTEEQHREYHAGRMREYRRKTNETLEKTRELLNGIKAKLAVNVITLRNRLNSTDVEEEVKTNAAQFLGIEKEKVLDIPELLHFFQKYWQRKKIVSELNVEHKSFVYMERALQLQKQYSDHKMRGKGARCPAQLSNKLKDASMKADAYEKFMDDKRVRKVLKELQMNETKLKENVGQWILNRVFAPTIPAFTTSV
ncbi:unnamed protein product [Caenorhabditis sp. 36 PRJEB53466]|nr:unnamed protein product [Caenorhabditis sp. 36 PRJEB53466]